MTEDAKTWKQMKSDNVTSTFTALVVNEEELE